MWRETFSYDSRNNRTNAINGTGSNAIIAFNINDSGSYQDEAVDKDLASTLVHEVSRHAWEYVHGISPLTQTVTLFVNK